jgi:hypothetical protein
MNSAWASSAMPPSLHVRFKKIAIAEGETASLAWPDDYGASPLTTI